jgi:hypothetical protein
MLIGLKTYLWERDMTTNLTIKYLPISVLKPNPKNPRKHNDRQIRQLAKSIRAVGFNVPILVDQDDKVIAGHGRILAAGLLGMQEVPTIRLDHLTEAQATVFMIADNRLTEIAVWDDLVLAEQLKTLSEADLNFSLEATGFTMGEIDLRIEGLSTGEEKEDLVDKLPPLPVGPPVTKPGDLWLLGDRHRLLCGNALEGPDCRMLMNSAKAVMVFTDPPYNVKIDGHVSGLGSIRHREFAMAAGEMSETEFISFLTRACSLMARYSTDGSIHFLCMDWRHMAELLEAGRMAYTELKTCVYGPKTMRVWALCTAASMSWSLCSSTAGRHIVTMSIWEGMGDTVPMSGAMEAAILFHVRRRKETSGRYIRP